MDIFEPNEQKLQVTLLVLPESSMMSLASVLDTMRAANRIASRDLFEWKIATLNGKPARLTCDLCVDPDTLPYLDDRSAPGDQAAEQVHRVRTRQQVEETIGRI